MFQTFTGSSRRPRQVNLSGTNPNPFKKSALASAQEERAQRQQERDRLNAAKTLQRTWRGHTSRQQVNKELQHAWDQVEEQGGGPLDNEVVVAYAGLEEDWEQLRMLLRFCSVRVPHDLKRLERYCRRHAKTLDGRRETQDSGVRNNFRMAHLRLLKLLLSALSDPNLPGELSYVLLQAVTWIVRNEPSVMNASKEIPTAYYKTLSVFEPIRGEQAAILEALLVPLQEFDQLSPIKYTAFSTQFLPTLNYDYQQSLLENLADHVNIKILARSLATSLPNYLSRPFQGASAVPDAVDSLQNLSNRLRLLGYFVYFHQHAHRFGDSGSYSSHPDFVTVVSLLLTSVVDEVSFDGRDYVQDANISPQTKNYRTHAFLRDQISSLVNEQSIRGLLASTHTTSQGSDEQEESPMGRERLLASYALTLLRCFPSRSDDIRMWLYLGSTSVSQPAIPYFWKAARRTTVFQRIFGDSREAIELLKTRPAALQQMSQSSNTFRWTPAHAAIDQQKELEDEWRVIFLFFELYTVVLKVMDDEEFFSASGYSASGAVSTMARANALPLDDVKALTTFLKNLGFTMCYNASDITSSEARDAPTHQLTRLLHREEVRTAAPSRQVSTAFVSGITGITLDYVKGLVTGLLRMVYERDSRRRFLPVGHWLMTERFNMNAFIDDVVEEEEKRHLLEDSLEDIEEEEEGNEVANSSNPELLWFPRPARGSTSKTRRLHESTPRLEILQNMPFFIPFETRVQIFRTFVHIDQIKRREGAHDPEMWRMSMSMHHPNRFERHHARIRREHEFEDAYTQFYGLKEALKEPIQITFVDKFDTEEVGIDGGGVTKEFLTTVTGQAFTPQPDQMNLFVETDQHLLYPNPAAVETRKELLSQSGYQERSAHFKTGINDLLQRYEFLGRIIGKCLYEGILVDVNFAPFFLLKWSLTGGTGAAPKESGYRANLNDLRDLDEPLYQGLLKLKNYPGDVEDFALNFTITDTITTDFRFGTTKAITRDLRPNGANIPVTNSNRLLYISDVARHRLRDEPYRQTSAFLQGLASMIQPSWLSMFNQSELQTLVGGTSSSIDVADLRRNTSYGGVYVIGNDGLEHESVQIFWKVMQALGDSERRAVLKFVTSTPRAPLLGFGSLNPRFSIRDAGDDQERLPSTSTCVNLLKLPRYKSEAVLREKLLYAVNSGAGFDLS